MTDELLERYHVRMNCLACGNRTTVNLEAFAARRIALLRDALKVADCGLCKARALTGEIGRGFVDDAQMVLDGRRVLSWSQQALDEAAAEAKQRGGT